MCEPNELNRDITDSDLELIRPYAKLLELGEPSYSKVCMYTCTPDGSFIFNQKENITYVSACSGHGFKHSVAIGEELALKLKF